ncbi:MAG: bifunctional demethylmenaquinone methyltransferase/2-methoxy-6-polyprenyl-1,4-benzoquinol methylase UbiE [Alphaproteobacteria bacterium]
MDDKADFGFKKIDRNLKQSLVGEIFSSVASNYDLMNNLMSLGIHHLWKKEMIKELPLTQATLLDVAGGTGDISTLYYNKAKSKGNNPHITIYDINYNMLNVGRDKLINKNIHNINFVCGNAEILPFKENHFEYFTIAFGIRNVTNIENALKEAYRVLKPGGKFVCLEFSHVNNELLSRIYDFYSFKVIPTIGKMVARNSDAYQYLVESIRKFPRQEEFVDMIANEGFKKAKYYNLTGGITAIFTAYKI